MIESHDEAMLELAALRAIDALEAEEAALIDRHMGGCAACREEFARSLAAGTALAIAASAPAPPHLRDRVLHAAVKVRRIVPWYRRPAVAFAVAAAAIVVVAGSWVMTHNRAQQQQETWALQCAPAAAGCGGQVQVVEGTLQVRTHGMPPLPPGKVYQAWIIHPKESPIPEPTFTATAQGEGSVDIPAGAGKGDVVAVTIEPQGGSRVPTSKPIMVATIE